MEGLLFLVKECMERSMKMEEMKIQFDHVSLEPSRQIGLHQQSTWELSYIIKGAGRRIVGDKEDPFKSGDIVLVPPDTTHCWEFEDEGTLIENVTVLFSTEFMYALSDNFYDLKEIMGRLIHIDSALMLLGRTRQSVANILRRMCEEEDDMRTVSFFQILVLIGKSAELSAAGKENRETNAERMLKNIKLFVTCNFRRESSIGDIAAYVGMNRSAVCTFFRRNEGETIGKYKNELRLDEARRLLASSAFSIQEICYKSGFRDVAHFCRTFRKITGTSPSEYRKKSKYELTQIDADF